MITGDKRDTLERWLFNLTEPPFRQNSQELALEYAQNLRELKSAEEGSTWEVEALTATPAEISEVIETRLRWLMTQER